MAAPRKINTTEAVELHADGWTSADIAERYEVTASTGCSPFRPSPACPFHHLDTEGGR